MGIDDITFLKEAKATYKSSSRFEDFSGLDEVFYLDSNPKQTWVKKIKGDPIINISDIYFRPTEVDKLLGDSKYAKTQLNWKPKITLQEMVKEMIDSDIKLAEQDKFINEQNK